MTPLRALRGRLGWSVPEIAARLGVARQTVYAWDVGRNRRGHPCSAPADVMAWLERAARAVETINSPARYRARAVEPLGGM